MTTTYTILYNVYLYRLKYHRTGTEICTHNKLPSGNMLHILPFLIKYSFTLHCDSWEKSYSFTFFNFVLVSAFFIERFSYKLVVFVYTYRVITPVVTDFWWNKSGIHLKLFPILNFAYMNLIFEKLLK